MPQTRVHSFPVVAEDFDVTRAKIRVNGAYIDLQDALDTTTATSSDGPLSGQMVMLERSPQTRIPAGLIWNPTDQEWILIDHRGRGHLQDRGSLLIARRTRDHGDTFREEQTLFSGAGTEDRVIRCGAFMRIESTDRIIGLICTGSGATRKVWAAKSDDMLETVTWTEVTSSITQANPFLYGEMFPLPAVAGGHATLGAGVLAYAGTTDIKLIYTTDGGETWADRVLCSKTGIPSSGYAQEPSIVPLQDGRWLILTRTSLNTNIYARLFDSALTQNAGSWIDTGVPLGNHVIHALVEDEWLHAYVFYRTSVFGTAEYESVAAHYKVLATTVADNPTVLGTMTPSFAFSLPDNGLSYPKSTRRPLNDGTAGPWMHYMSVGHEFDEGQVQDNEIGSGAVLIRQTPGAAAGMSLRDRPRQLIECPTFDVWPYGSSFTGVASETPIAARVRSAPSGGTMTFEKVAIPNYVRSVVPFRPNNGLKITATANDFTGWNQRWRGNDAISMYQRLAGRRRLMAVLYGWNGVIPSDFNVSVSATPTANEGTLLGGTAVSLGNAAFTEPQGVAAGAPWMATAALYLKAPDNMGSIGLTPTNVSTVTLSFTTWNTSAALDMSIAGWFLFDGETPGEYETPTPAEAQIQALRYSERILCQANNPISGTASGMTATVAWAPLMFHQKATTPTISGPTDPTKVQLRSSAAIAATGVSFSGISTRSARMTVEVAAGLSAAGSYLPEWTTTDAAEAIIVNCE